MANPSYEKDFYAWSMAQAKFLENQEIYQLPDLILDKILEE